MTVTTLNYSTFNESYIDRIITKALSIPTIGSILRGFFYRKTVTMYANLLLEVSGFQEYTAEMNKEDAKQYIKRFTKMHDLMLVLKKNFPSRADNQDFVVIISKLVNKLADNIEILEDIANPDFSYQMTVSNENNDWNDPLNDHWDNY